MAARHVSVNRKRRRATQCARTGRSWPSEAARLSLAAEASNGRRLARPRGRRTMIAAPQVAGHRGVKTKAPRCKRGSSGDRRRGARSGCTCRSERRPCSSRAVCLPRAFTESVPIHAPGDAPVRRRLRLPPAGSRSWPKERAIEGRQVSVDNESCTTVIEVGEPDVGPRLQSVEPVGGAVRRVNVRENAGSTPSGDIGPNRAAPNLCASPPAAGMRLPKRIYAGMRGFRFLPSAQVSTRRMRSMGNRSARPLCGGSPGSIESAGRYQVTWYAYVDLELTITRPHLTWWWNGHCATGSYGEGYWWWQSWTGWNNTSYSTAWLGRTSTVRTCTSEPITTTTRSARTKFRFGSKTLESTGFTTAI